MHEMALAKGVLDIVESYAVNNNAKKVTEITVLVGEMTGVVWESLEFCFQALSQNTMAEGAKLIMKPVPLIGRCGKCGNQEPIENYKFICSACGSSQIQIISGRELRVESLEAE